MLLANNSAVSFKGITVTIFCVVPHCNNDLYNVVWYKRDGKDPIEINGGHVIHTTLNNDIQLISNVNEYLKGIFKCEISNSTTDKMLYTLYLGFFEGITKGIYYSKIFIYSYVILSLR